MKPRKKQGGFTLVELSLVILLALLTSYLLFVAGNYLYQDSQGKAVAAAIGQLDMRVREARAGDYDYAGISNAVAIAEGIVPKEWAPTTTTIVPYHGTSATLVPLATLPTGSFVRYRLTFAGRYNRHACVETLRKITPSVLRLAVVTTAGATREVTADRGKVPTATEIAGHCAVDLQQIIIENA